MSKETRAIETFKAASGLSVVSCRPIARLRDLEPTDQSAIGGEQDRYPNGN